MKWSLDTHKYISEVTRKALQIMVEHGINSESDQNEIDAVERDLAKAGVYKNYESAKGRVKRALFTYFKAYNCLDSAERLTPIGKLYVENNLSIKEFSFHYILHYKYEDDEVAYYPAQLILTTLVKIHNTRSDQSYLTSYDFSKIVECDGIEDITDNFINKLLSARNEAPISVDERSIGYDIWAKMLIQAGILQKNVDKNLEAVNYNLIQWILASYEKHPISEKGEIVTGVLCHIPVVNLVKPHGSITGLKNEGHALQAFLFDEVDDYTIGKYIATVPFKDTKEILGITELSQGFYRDFVGLERLVGYSLAQNANPAIKCLGEIIAGAELTESELVAIDEITAGDSGYTSTEMDGVGENVLFYGVPGSGKSHLVKTKYPLKYGHYERVVFHPDYTYSDFIGQIMPRIEKTVDGEKLRYVFNAGPFTKILAAAIKDSSKEPYFLVIEEINRGNAPAIFGEIFQLLDRNEYGESEYGITNFDIAEYICDGEDIDPKTYEVKIPSNLWILATMNTSDQNVFTLDTAFQRRWIMKHISNDFSKAPHSTHKIEKSTITWEAFAEVINEKVLEVSAGISSAEDKRLGAFFVTDRELKADRFPEKVLKYLWDDAFKMEPEYIFSEGLTSLDAVIDTFNVSSSDALSQVLRCTIYNEMLNKMASNNIETEEDPSTEED